MMLLDLFVVSILTFSLGAPFIIDIQNSCGAEIQIDRELDSNGFVLVNNTGLQERLCNTAIKCIGTCVIDLKLFEIHFPSCSQTEFSVVSVLGPSEEDHYPVFNTYPHFCGQKYKPDVVLDQNGEQEWQFILKTKPGKTESHARLAFSAHEPNRVPVWPSEDTKWQPTITSAQNESGVTQLVNITVAEHTLGVSAASGMTAAEGSVSMSPTNSSGMSTAMSATRETVATTSFYFEPNRNETVTQPQGMIQTITPDGFYTSTSFTPQEKLSTLEVEVKESSSAAYVSSQETWARSVTDSHADGSLSESAGALGNSLSSINPDFTVSELPTSSVNNFSALERQHKSTVPKEEQFSKTSSSQALGITGGTKNELEITEPEITSASGTLKADSSTSDQTKPSEIELGSVTPQSSASSYVETTTVFSNTTLTTIPAIKASTESQIQVSTENTTILHKDTTPSPVLRCYCPVSLSSLSYKQLAGSPILNSNFYFEIPLIPSRLCNHSTIISICKQKCRTFALENSFEKFGSHLKIGLSSYGNTPAVLGEAVCSLSKQNYSKVRLTLHSHIVGCPESEMSKVPVEVLDNKFSCHNNKLLSLDDNRTVLSTPVTSNTTTASTKASTRNQETTATTSGTVTTPLTEKTTISRVLWTRSTYRNFRTSPSYYRKTTPWAVGASDRCSCMLGLYKDTIGLIKTVDLSPLIRPIALRGGSCRMDVKECEGYCRDKAYSRDIPTFLRQSVSNKRLVDLPCEGADSLLSSPSMLYLYSQVNACFGGGFVDKKNQVSQVVPLSRSFCCNGDLNIHCSRKLKRESSLNGLFMK